MYSSKVTSLSNIFLCHGCTKVLGVAPSRCLSPLTSSDDIFAVERWLECSKIRGVEMLNSSGEQRRQKVYLHHVEVVARRTRHPTWIAHDIAQWRFVATASLCDFCQGYLDLRSKVER